MTLDTVSWLAIIANGALAGLNTYHMIRLHRARRAVEAYTREWMRRVLVGDVRVTADDGRVGRLSIVLEGKHGIRLALHETDAPSVH